jgi:hypothetical protein
MEPVTYAMQFRGSGAPNDSGVIRARSVAPSARLVSTVGPTGVSFALEPTGEGEALFESEVRMGEGTSFEEDGTITFGPGNRVHFRTIGEGYLAPSTEPGVSHGVVMWEITGGEGAFEGATGLITSNFMATESLEVTDNQFGVIWVNG